MNKFKTLMLGVLITVMLGLTPVAKADDDVDFGLSVGVGDYDYLPYSGGAPRSLNFHAVLGDYGHWVDVAPFGRTWRPYAASGWKPYLYGHWTTTQYGQTWVGYEPWGWLAYHYGNWIYSQRYGWVWVPGYEYHPGRVAWSTSYDSLGWMPAPPHGYDYSRGYLSYRGPRNQFSYHDDDFAVSFGWGDDDYYHGGPYYSPYRDHYYNRSYLNVVPNLWVFIGRDRYFDDNYADCYLGNRYARNVFERRLVRINSRPLHRDVLERIVKRRVRVVPVRENIIELDRRRARIVVPEGESTRVRRHANRVVREIVAPAFAERKVAFKGKSKLRTVPREALIKEGRKLQQEREVQRTRRVSSKEKQILTLKAREKNDRKDNDRLVRPEKKKEVRTTTQFDRRPDSKADRKVTLKKKDERREYRPTFRSYGDDVREREVRRSEIDIRERQKRDYEAKQRANRESEAKQRLSREYETRKREKLDDERRPTVFKRDNDRKPELRVEPRKDFRSSREVKRETVESRRFEQRDDARGKVVVKRNSKEEDLKRSSNKRSKAKKNKFDKDRD